MIQPGRDLVPTRYLVIWNPDAGSRVGLPTNLARESTLRRAMSDYGLGEELFASPSVAATCARLDVAANEGYDVVVAAGGDGTVGVVAKHLIGTDIALGILPTGSLMNIARSLGIPRDVDAAAQVIATGMVKTIDVGRSRGGLFFEVASIGMGAALLGETHEIATGRLGSIRELIRAFVFTPAARMSIEIDDRTIQTDALMVAVANAPFTGAGLALAPDARLDDGRFDICVYRRFSRLGLLVHLGTIAAGRRHHSPRIDTYRSRRVQVAALRPLPVRADAMDLGTTPVGFVVLPAALRVIVRRQRDR